MAKVQKDIQKDFLDNEEYTLRKRLPRNMPRRKNDVYITKKTSFEGQFKRCEKLLNELDYQEIVIHGLGAAINRAMTLALKLQGQMSGLVEIAVNTSTVELVDDLEPSNDNVEADTQARNNSAVHIRLFKVANEPIGEGEGASV